jgi:hypothetical protein
MTPLEYCSQLIYELNTLSASQGIANPIHMMMSIPTQGLQPVDPDYSAASDWVLNAVSVVMSGNLGYNGLLNSPNNPSLILEFSNETWNFGQAQANYLAYLTFVRNGSATTDASTMSALRSTIMARNVAGNSPYRSRVKLTLGMQGGVGYTAPNTTRATGSANYFADAWNTWQGGLTPISQHDCCNYGTYFDPANTYVLPTAGTGTFTDDSAMYNGTDNSGNGGGNYTGAANQSQAIANFITSMTVSPSAGDQTVAAFCQHTNPTAGYSASFDTAMAGFGKRAIGYEGGTDWQTANGGTLGSGTHHNITANDSLFLKAINQSTQWATEQIQFMDDVKNNLSSSGFMPIYTFLSGSTADLRWAYAAPDTYAGGVEGAALTVNSPLWTALGTRNQAFS